MRKKIIVASGNLHKVQEFRQILENFDIEVLSKKEAGYISEVEETGSTLEENSKIKARAVYGATGCAVLADDSGLFVRALQWQPGVYSARYAGEPSDDKSNNALLLRNLETEADRYAEFRCVLAYIMEDGSEHIFTGICPGTLLKELRGKEGFGYDPLFVPDGYSQTFAELSGIEKNKISHRALALRKFVAFLGNTCYANLRSE